MQGIKIGDGAIIGTNGLVNKDVPPYTIVAGNYAREIRKRFDPETINFLSTLQWWNWPIKKLTEHLDLITSGDIDRLRYFNC